MAKKFETEMSAEILPENISKNESVDDTITFLKKLSVDEFNLK